VDKVDEDYFRHQILPLIDGPELSLSGRSTSVRKQNFWARLPRSYSRLFDLPGVEEVKEVVISRQVVEGTTPPLYIYADQTDRAGGAGASA
jgi:hypothetical protein